MEKFLLVCHNSLREKYTIDCFGISLHSNGRWLRVSSIHLTRSYRLGDEYEYIKNKASKLQALYPDVVKFNNPERTVTFITEKLIPVKSLNRPLILLLFSNPHPHSIRQGMFLSPSTKGVTNPFWRVMQEAGWLSIPNKGTGPKELREICLEVKYKGSFEFIFYCYYAFPTSYPEEIPEIFGKEFFKKKIEPEARDEFRQIVQNLSPAAVVTFNKGIFNLVSEAPVNTYIDRLKLAEIVRSKIKAIDRYIPVFLTFPTGWHYHKQYRQLRKDSLIAIKDAILRQIGASSTAS
jgi:hypothetical protein